MLADGRIGKFGWKAQFATLEEFVASACANELGLGNPMMEQAKPWAHRAYTKVNPDLDQTQFRSLVAFVDTLPRPIEVMPLDPKERRGHRARQDVVRAGRLRGLPYARDRRRGGRLQRFPPASSHRPARVWAAVMPRFPARPLPDGHPLPDEWKTPPLWGVADSAPYFHDGGSPTLEAAIRRHHGDAASVTRAFESLPTSIARRSSVLEEPQGSGGSQARRLVRSRGHHRDGTGRPRSYATRHR